MNSKRSAWWFAGAGALLLAVLAWWLWGSDTKEPPTTCADDAACGVDAVCCAGRCVPGAACEPSLATSAEPGSTPVATPTKPRRAHPKPRRASPPKPSDEAPGDCKQPSDCASSLMACEQGTCREAPLCTSDVDCFAGRACYHGRCTANPPGCRAADCPQGSYCNSVFGQCEQHACANDNDCAGTRRCNTEKRYCVECLVNDDCEGNQTCIDDQRCVEPESCKNDEDCRGLRVCNAELHRCEDSACEVDPLEPNNKRDQATILKPGDEHQRLIVCDENNDFFRVDIAQGHGALVHVSFDTGVGSIELRLQNTEGKEIGRVNDVRFEGSMVASFERVDEPTTYYIRVAASGRIESINAPVPYNIRRHDVPGGYCINDEYEPNNSPDAVTTLPLTHRFLVRLCTADEDWFKVQLDAKDLLIVYLEGAFDPAHPTTRQLLPDVEIYGGASLEEALLVDDQDDPEPEGAPSKQVSFTASEPSTYYVRVLPALVDANTRYIIGLSVQEPAP